MDATIQVRKRGTLTLPAEVRRRYNIKPGGIFSIFRGSPRSDRFLTFLQRKTNKCAVG